jgi:purine-nucleoside phosphorylase
METFISMAEIDRARDFIAKKIKVSPKVGIILGSGLGGLADAVENADVLSFNEIPEWPMSTVEGHAGRLVVGTLQNTPVMVMQGRVHYYEGYRMDQVTFPVRVMNRLGVEILIVTNAAGAIDPRYAPGDVMMINDHISLIGMTGLNPLRGPNIDEIGIRFPDMSQAYDRGLMDLARGAAKQHNIQLWEGVYICLSGPSFESPADLRFLRTIGADAVGMSTVPEVIVARHGGMKVLGLSGISNKANLDGNTITTHHEVLEAGNMIVPKMTKIILSMLSNL